MQRQPAHSGHAHVGNRARDAWQQPGVQEVFRGRERRGIRPADSSRSFVVTRMDSSSSTIATSGFLGILCSPSS